VPESHDFFTLAESMEVAVFFVQGAALRYVNPAAGPMTGTREEILAMQAAPAASSTTVGRQCSEPPSTSRHTNAWKRRAPLRGARGNGARGAERTRLGFDLHDNVCQGLVGVGMLVASVRQRLGPERLELASCDRCSYVTSGSRRACARSRCA
jgi:signal transduction histidine kinase